MLDEDGDARPRAQAQRPFGASTDGQPTTNMVHGDGPAKQQQRVQRNLARQFHVNKEGSQTKKQKNQEADLGDVAQVHFGSLDAPEAHYNPGAPARLGELDARRVHPHPCAAHVLRPPLMRARVPFRRSTRPGSELDRVPRDPRDARVQRCEKESLEQLRLARVRVWLCRDEPCGLKRGEEIVAQEGDVADRRSGDVVLGGDGLF